MVSSLTCLASENGRGQFPRGIVSGHCLLRVSLEMELVGLHEGGARWTVEGCRVQQEEANVDHKF